MAVVALIVLVSFSLWFLDRSKLASSLDKLPLALFILYILSAGLSNTVLSSLPGITILGYKNWSTGYYFSALCVLLLIAVTVKTKTESGKSINGIPYFIFTIILLFICLSENLGFNVLLGSDWFLYQGKPLTLSSTSYPIAGIGNSGLLSGLWILLIPLPLLALKRSVWIYLTWTALIAIGLGSVHSKSSLLVYAVFSIAQCLWMLRRKQFFMSFWCILTLSIGYAALPILQVANRSLFQQGIVERLNSQVYNPSSKDYGLSAGSRLTIYKSTASLIFMRPLMGWGYETLQEHFFDELSNTEYQKFIGQVVKPKPDETVRRFGNVHVTVKKSKPDVGISAQAFTIVKPHNTVLEEIYSNGIIGFAFIAGAFFFSVRKILRQRNRTALVLLTSCTLYFVYLMFWFTSPGVTTFAAILFGLAVRLSEPDSSATLSP